MKKHWIKVEDRLPEKGKRVLVCLLWDYENAPWKFTVTTGYCNGKNNWDGEENRGLMEPYAWMELPDPPDMPIEAWQFKAAERKAKKLAKEGIHSGRGEWDRKTNK